MAPIKIPEQKKERANGVIVGTCIAFVVGMTGMAYAAVPLYDTTAIHADAAVAWALA